MQFRSCLWLVVGPQAGGQAFPEPLCPLCKTETATTLSASLAGSGQDQL